MADTWKENNAVSVSDLGDQVAVIIFKSETISSAAAAYAAAAVEELKASCNGIVVAGAGDNFCSGIDLAEIKAAAAAKEWGRLQLISEAYQSFTREIKYSKVPVVTLAKGNVMDFGLEVAAVSAEVILADNAVVVYNTAKNGFAPMGGGLTQAAIEAYAIGAGVPGADLVPFLKRTFGNLYNGRPAAGAEAKAKGWLSNCRVLKRDACTLQKAKETALTLYNEGYKAPLPVTVMVKGFTGRGALDVMALNAALGFFIPESLCKIACQVSRVMTGGDVPNRTEAPEVQLLKLEKEAFMKTMQEASWEGLS